MICKYITIFTLTSPLLFLSNYLRIKGYKLSYIIQPIVIFIFVIVIANEQYHNPILSYICNIFKVCCNS